MDIGAELRQVRRSGGISQRELAERAGTSQATISAYESGRKEPSLATAARLFDVMGTRLIVAAPPRPRAAAEHERAGRILADVIALAEELPFRPRATLDYPRLSPRT